MNTGELIINIRYDMEMFLKHIYLWNKRIKKYIYFTANRKSLEPLIFKSGSITNHEQHEMVSTCEATRASKFSKNLR